MFSFLIIREKSDYMELLVSPLNFLELEDSIFENEELDFISQFTLTKSNSKLAPFYVNNFISKFGIIDIKIINDSKVKMYTIKNRSYQISDKIINDELHNMYGISQMFSLALWFVKDNSVNTDFSLYYNTNNGFSFIVRKNLMVSNSQGIYGSVLFNNSEYNRAIVYMNMLSGILEYEERDFDKYESYNNLNNNLNQNTDSFNRALRYLQIARNESFIPSKIASYISILETLFAISDSNTYKTPERASLFVGNSLEDKQKIFKLTKDAYDVRSSYVHGSDIYRKHNKVLEKISQDLDGIIRKVMLKFFLDHSELNYTGDDSTKVNKYFIDLVLS